MFRGRPCTVQTSLLVEAVLKHKDKIVLANGTDFVKEKNEIWKLISEELLNKVKASSLYSYVVNDRFNLKQLLLGLEKPKSIEESHDDINSTTISNDDSLDENSNFLFQLTFGKAEFDSLITQTTRIYKDKSHGTRVRIVNILKPNEWAELIAKKIYDDLKLNHGYHFESHYINLDKTSGSFQGHCNCGSFLKGQILPPLESQNIIKIQCKATAGNGKCGKRQLRAKTRENVVSELQKLSVEAYRTSKAAVMMKEGDFVEPPHLYQANVLRNAKHQEVQRQYRDKDPIIAMSKFKRSSEGQNIVRDIGIDPVKVIFWSPHQNRIYNHMNKKKDSCLSIDATGKLVQKLKHVDGQMSQHIFLYLGVLSSSGAQFAVPSMFSERQDTVTISFWLTRWIQSGADYPKEVVCDCSRALLNACCRSFTGIESRELYAEAVMSKDLPRSYIRIDIAHYLKKWADSLKNEKREVKRFYLFAVGQVVLCRNKQEATAIIEALLLISQSETAGSGAASLLTALDFVKSLIVNPRHEIEERINSILDDEEMEDFNEEEKEEVDNKERVGKGILYEWTEEMKKNVSEILQKEKGNDLNPRHCPKFSKRLLDHMEIIPLWSCCYIPVT